MAFFEGFSSVKRRYRGLHEDSSRGQPTTRSTLGTGTRFSLPSRPRSGTASILLSRAVRQDCGSCLQQNELHSCPRVWHRSRTSSGEKFKRKQREWANASRSPDVAKYLKMRTSFGEECGSNEPCVYTSSEYGKPPPPRRQVYSISPNQLFHNTSDSWTCSQMSSTCTAASLPIPFWQTTTCEWRA